MFILQAVSLLNNKKKQEQTVHKPATERQTDKVAIETHRQTNRHNLTDKE